MAATIKIDYKWTADQKKKFQQWLNRYGFTDANGNKLEEDGIIGSRTNEALDKMNRYRTEKETPSWDTQQLQKQLNDMGYQDADGSPLKEDGVYGPKTDAANNEFENSFLGGLSNGVGKKDENDEDESYENENKDESPTLKKIPEEHTASNRKPPDRRPLPARKDNQIRDIWDFLEMFIIDDTSYDGDGGGSW